MTRTVAVTGYTFDELESGAQDRVRSWINEYMPDLWADDSEYWTEQLQGLGYSDIDVRYSGFGCQGDGASIQCKVDARQFILRNKLGNKYAKLLNALKSWNVSDYVAVVRGTYPHYVHEYMLSASVDEMQFDLEQSGKAEAATTAVVAQAEDLAPLVLDEVRDWSRKIYKSLEADYFSHFEDEYVSETCEANEYLFDATGRPIHHLAKAA